MIGLNKLQSYWRNLICEAEIKKTTVSECSVRHNGDFEWEAKRKANSSFHWAEGIRGIEVSGYQGIRGIRGIGDPGYRSIRGIRDIGVNDHGDLEFEVLIARNPIHRWGTEKQNVFLINSLFGVFWCPETSCALLLLSKDSWGRHIHCVYLHTLT